jgi:NAD(P)-dependent dehydrogenase (short-subunit alcohol dehydrogenase family)
VKYRDRVAVVTGAGSGIGRALTRALTHDGAHVAASDIDERGLAETQAACRPGQVTTYRVDVTDRDAVFAYAEGPTDARWRRCLGSSVRDTPASWRAPRD